MADIYDEMRRKMGLSEVGGGTSLPTANKTSNDPFDELRMSFGLIPDTRPKPSEPTMQEKISQGKLPSMNLRDSPLVQEAAVRAPQIIYDQPAGPPPPSNQGSRYKPIMDSTGFRADNLGNNIGTAISSGLSAVQNAISEYAVPDQPMLTKRQPGDPIFRDNTNLPGTSARDEFLQRSGQKAATGASKLIGQVTAPFFVPGAGLGTGNAASEAARGFISKASPRLQGLGQTAAREGIAGGLVGAGSEYAQGGADPVQALISGGIGAAGGAALPLAGRALQNTRFGKSITDYFSRPATTPEAEQPFSEMLALPLGRGDARLAAARERSGFNTGEPLAPAPDIPANALPQGNYIQPQRLRVQDPTEVLNTVMQRIKPEVEQTIAALRQSGQPVDVPEIAFAAASKHGYDLPSLLDGKAPSVAERVAKDAQTRAYGIYPDQLPNVQQPEGFNISRTAQAAAPETKLGFRQGGMQQAPRQTVREAAQSLGREMQPPPRPVNLQEAAPPMTLSAPARRGGLREFGTLTSLKNSEKTNPETIVKIGEKGKTDYRIKPNQTTLDNANRKLEKRGEDGSKSYLLNKDKRAVLSSDDLTLGYRLIDQYQAKGDYDSAADVALKLMQSNLEGGRSIQANAIYNRLTPEGALRVATREYNKGVESLADQKPIPPQVAEQITEAATKLRSATGNTQLAKDAMSLFEKARSGEKLNEAEISQLRKFAAEAKKYVGEAPKRKRDIVVEYTTKQADAARKRIAASKNIGFLPKSSNPLIDHIIIGVDHMAKGAVKYADFAENMTKEFGSNVENNLDELYVDSWKRYQRLNKLKMTDFEKMVSQAISGESIAPQKANVMRRMAIELSQLEGKAQIDAMAELQLAFNSISEGTRGQKAASLLRSSQLGNVRTMLRNEVSNNLFYALDTIRRKFAVIPDIITPGGRTAFFQNNPNSWKQYFSDWKEGWGYGKQGINPKGLETQYDLGSLSFNPTSTKLTDRVGSFLERHVGALMKASDYASANRAISTELYQMAQAKAYKEGLRGKALKDKAESYFHNADNTMQEEALKYGEYMTFQDRNFLSTAAVKLKEDVLNFGKDFGLGNIVFNYPKTPANILMRSFDYSPLGYLKFMTQVGRAAFKKDVTKKEMIDSFTRATAGTGMAAMGAYLASIGLLNVLPSKDSAVNSLERSAGVIPNSINVDGLIRYVTSFGDREAAKPRKGDVFRSIDWLQPMAITGSVGASFAQAQSSSRLKTSVGAADALVQSLDAAAESAGNMSVYRNIKDLVGSEYQGAGEKIGRLASNAATAGIPSLLGQLRNAIDPNVRDTKDENVLMQIGKSVVNRLPGASKLLPERRDTFGKEMKSDYGPMGRVFNSFVNPSIVDEYNPSEGAKVVLDLINRTGQPRLAPNFPSKTFTHRKETYKFTPEEYRQFQTKVGARVEEGLNKDLQFLNDPARSDQQKMDRMDKIMSDALEHSKIDYRKMKGIK